jgi:hypothetical protein
MLVILLYAAAAAIWLYFVLYGIGVVIRSCLWLLRTARRAGPQKTICTLIILSVYAAWLLF